MAPPPYHPTAPISNPDTSNICPSAPGALDDKTAKVRELCERYRISQHFESALWSLNEYHIIFVCDDSGSMSTTAGGKTRWDELKQVIGEVYDISLIFDPVGMFIS